MPLTLIFTLEISGCCGIDFMCSFLSSGGYLYILIALDNVSKWVKATTYRNNNQQTIINFLKNIYCLDLGIPKLS